MVKHARPWIVTFVVASACSAGSHPHGSAYTNDTASDAPRAPATPVTTTTTPATPTSPPDAPDPPPPTAHCAEQAPQPLHYHPPDSPSSVAAIHPDGDSIYLELFGATDRLGVDRLQSSGDYYARSEAVVRSTAPWIFRGAAFDATFIYWTETDRDNQIGRILRKPKSGGDPVELLRMTAPRCELPGSLRVHGDNLYFGTGLDISYLDTCSIGGKVYRLPASGGTPTLIGQSHYPNQGIPLIEADDRFVWWRESDDIIRIPVDGGQDRVFGDFDESLVYYFDTDKLWWGEGRGGIGSIDLVTGDSVDHVATDGGLRSLLVDHGQKYWSVDTDGTNAYTIVIDPDGTYRYLAWFASTKLAIDSRYLYMSSGGEIYRVCR